MTITKKHLINIAKIIDENTPHNDDAKQNLVDSLSRYFKSENKNFDSIRFYNACFKTFKPLSDKQEIEYNNIKWIKENKILQSKVKTYEADINKGIYVYNDNCYCDKCEQHREDPQAINLIQQSLNNTK